MKIGKFSFSKLDTFGRCPRKAFYRYIAGLKEPPAEPLLVGRGTHAGQEHDNLERIDGRRPPMGEICDVAVATYEGDGGADTDSFVIQHDAQLEEYWKSGERDKLHPVKGTVEAPFEISLSVTADPEAEPKEPAILQGFVDVLSQEEGDEAPGAVDYKTVKRPFSDHDVDKDLQLGLYMVGAESAWAKVVNFVKYKKQRATTKVTKKTRLTPSRIQYLLQVLTDTIGSFRKNVKSGDWPKCSPKCFWCSPVQCGFYSKCYPDKNPNQSKFISIDEVRPVGTLEQPEWRKKR